MAKRRWKKALLLLLVAAFVAAPLCMPVGVSAAEPTRYCYTTARINFRSAPSTTSAPLLSGTLGLYQVLPILGEATGTKVNGSTLWYQVSYVDRTKAKELVGYVHSSYVVVGEPFDFETTEFTDFPESYRPYLAALAAAHPNWTFVADKNGRDFSTVVASQSKVTWEGREPTSDSFVYDEYSKLYRSQTVIGGKNVSTVPVDGGTMYCANSATTAYFMDPRNFLNEVDIFMFSQQAFDADVHTVEGLESMMEGTYMEDMTTPNEEGETVTYAEAFFEAGKSNNLNPYYLLITSFTENGTVGTPLSKGNLDGKVCANAGCSDETHKSYYNFFGIGSTPGGSPQHNGLLYAKNKGWDTAYKAIVGGASFQSDSYISQGQDTPYFKKFNVSSYTQTASWHQYMQNLCHPENEAWQIFKVQYTASLLDLTHTFVIPVYSGMPEKASTLPTEESTGETPENPPSEDTDEGSAEYSTVYTVDDKGYLFGIAPNTSKKKLAEGFTLGEGTTLEASASVIGTGTVVRILYQGEEAHYFQAVIRGDLSGDGQLKALDLLYLRDHLLGQNVMKKAYLQAADVDGNGKVDALDLLKLRDHLLGTYTISQKG